MPAGNQLGTPMMRSCCGWCGVLVAVTTAAVWANSGAIQNFQEGWYYPSAWRNFGQMLAVYESPMLLLVIAGTVAIRWPRTGSVLLVLGGLADVFVFGWPASSAFAVALLAVLLGVLFWIGRPRPRWLAVTMLVVVPLVAVAVSGAYPSWRVLTRPAWVDGSMRRISGNGVNLVWAPFGPGWGKDGVSWTQAKDRCAHLTADGAHVSGDLVGVWRLPSTQEAAGTLIWRGRNAGGTFDPVSRTATYRVTPDKEAPVWDPFSPVTHFWTADERGDGEAEAIAFDGAISRFPETTAQSDLGYRCVKDPAALGKR